MNSNKPKNTLNIRSLYQDVQPDPWAVTRLKARLQRETKVTLDELVSRIFRRYVLAVSLVLLVLTLFLDSRITTIEEPQDEIATWLFGETASDAIGSEIPEYTFLTEIQDLP